MQLTCNLHRHRWRDLTDVPSAGGDAGRALLFLISPRHCTIASLVHPRVQQWYRVQVAPERSSVTTQHSRVGVASKGETDSQQDTNLPERSAPFVVVAVPREQDECVRSLRFGDCHEHLGDERVVDKRLAVSPRAVLHVRRVPVCAGVRAYVCGWKEWKKGGYCVWWW